MTEDKTLDIVKNAILLEHKGKALYESVVATTEFEAVKELFSMLMHEEENHIKVLNEQYSRLSKGGDYDVSGLESSHAAAAHEVLNKAIVENIFGAGYEAAVISAALEFEKNAVRYYSQQASQAASEEERKLYLWLSDWEKTHMLMLAQIDNEVKEKIWFDNQFWPLG